MKSTKYRGDPGRWKDDWRCKYCYFQKKYGNNSRRNMKGNGSVVTMNGGKMTGEEGEATPREERRVLQLVRAEGEEEIGKMIRFDQI